MNVYLKPITKRRFTEASSQLSQWVRDGTPEFVNPETKQLYLRRRSAFLSVARLAIRPDLHAYTVHEHDVPSDLGILGLGTIITGKRLRVKNILDPFEVNDLDYNLRRNATPEQHRQVAAKLINLSRQLSWQSDRVSKPAGPQDWRTQEEARHRFCATLDFENLSANVGFTQQPELVITDASYVDLANDADGIAKQNANLVYLVGDEIVINF
ncbi:MAG: hypothetical protein M3Q36_01495 [bacterium]|nr:hypothetical protein [bacterium]